MTTDRKTIYIELIDSYLPQLTEEDLYKLHDLVRNTVTSRAARVESDIKADINELTEVPNMGTNHILYSDTLNLPTGSEKSSELLDRFSGDIDVLKREINRLKFCTAPYGVIAGAWMSSTESGVDVFFGIYGVLDGVVRINATCGKVDTCAVDRRPVPVFANSTRTFSETYNFTRGDLCKGLQTLAKLYKWS